MTKWPLTSSAPPHALRSRAWSRRTSLAAGDLLTCCVLGVVSISSRCLPFIPVHVTMVDILSRCATPAGLRTPPRNQAKNRLILWRSFVKVTSVKLSHQGGIYSGIQSAQVKNIHILFLLTLLVTIQGSMMSQCWCGLFTPVREEQMRPKLKSQHVNMIRQDVTKAILAPGRKPAVTPEASASKGPA